MATVAANPSLPSQTAVSTASLASSIQSDIRKACVTAILVAHNTELQTTPLDNELDVFRAVAGKAFDVGSGLGRAGELKAAFKKGYPSGDLSAAHTILSEIKPEFEKALSATLTQAETAIWKQKDETTIGRILANIFAPPEALPTDRISIATFDGCERPNVDSASVLRSELVRLEQKHGVSFIQDVPTGIVK